METNPRNLITSRIGTVLSKYLIQTNQTGDLRRQNIEVWIVSTLPTALRMVNSRVGQGVSCRWTLQSETKGEEWATLAEVLRVSSSIPFTPNRVILTQGKDLYQGLRGNLAQPVKPVRVNSSATRRFHRTRVQEIQGQGVPCASRQASPM
jgi:hypothetical protein